MVLYKNYYYYYNYFCIVVITVGSNTTVLLTNGRPERKTAHVQKETENRPM